jgi:hypothetical protein
LRCPPTLPPSICRRGWGRSSGQLVACAGSANRFGHSLDCRRVGSLGLAIMIRPDLAERERRRGDPPTWRRSLPRLTVAAFARGRSLRTTATLERRSLALSPPLDRNDRCPPISASVHASISLRSGQRNTPGLGIVSNRLIGDDGATKSAKGLQRIYSLILCRSPFWN